MPSTDEQWNDAEQMTVDEIRALGHRWVPAFDGDYGGWCRCELCGALVPNDMTESPSLFRKTGSGSLLLTNHNAER